MNQIAIPVLALTCVALIFFPRPVVGFRRFLFLLPFLPTFLAIRLGGFAITSSRLPTAFLLLSVLLREPVRLRFRVYPPDVCFAVYVLMLMVSYGLTTEIGPGLQYCFGLFMDIGVPYLLVRMFVRSLSDISAFLKALLAPTTLIAFLALVQMQTGYNVFNHFKQGSEELGLGVYIDAMVRHGRYRADVGLSHFIMLGVYFAMLLPLANVHLRSLGYSSKQVLIRLAILGAGLASSVSGGAMLQGGIAIGFVMLWPLRQLWVLSVLCAITLIGFIEVASERSFLTVLAEYSATDRDSAHYRLWAPEIWINRYLPGHWLMGFGARPPDMGIAGDITNQYFLIIFRGGLAALLPFMLTFITGFACLLRASRMSVNEYLPRLSWAVAASMTSIALVMITVSFFGQVVSFLSMLLALPASILAATSIEARGSAPRPSPRPRGSTDDVT